MKLRDKLLLGYGLAILLLCVVAGIGLFASERVSRSFQIVAERSVPQIKALGDLRMAGLRIVASVTEFALIEAVKRDLTAPPESRFGEELERELIASATGQLTDALAQYQRTLGGSVAAERTIAHIRQLSDELIAAANDVMRAASDPAGPMQLLSRREVFEQREKAYLEHIDAELQASSAELEQRVAGVQSATELEVYLLVFAALFSVLIGMGAAMFVTRRVTRPLTVLTKATTEFTQGDLDVRVRPVSNDEIGALAAAFNRMGAELKRTTVTRDFLDKVVSTMSEALLVVDTDFRISMCNRAAVQLFGYREQELQRMSASLLLHTPSHDSCSAEAIEWLTDAGEESECVVYNRGGQTLAALVSGAIMLDRDDNVAGAVLIVRDITAAKDAERLLIKAKERAEYATRSKSAFLANMSHEIRTPLNGMLGNAELLAATRLDQRQQHFISTMLRSGENLLQVINDILDFSKIEAGKLSVDRADFDLRILIGEAVHALADSASSKGLELICELPPGEPLRARADALRVRQVLTNLLGNAIKFTEHGEVLVAARRCPESAAIRVEVRDSGIGLPADAQETVFESFTQVGAHRRGGTGLGLAVSKQLVELMGGSIGVESEPGEGSRFWFSCPLAARPAPRPIAPVTVLRGRRLLVVEPNASVRRVIADLALNWQCECRQFEDLAAAEAVLASSDPAELAEDFALVSAALLLGWRAHATEVNKLSYARMLAIGSVYEEARLERLRDSGVRGFLRKPILEDALQAALLELVDTDTVPSSQPTPIAQRPDGAPMRLNASVLVVDDNAVNRFLVQEILRQAECQVELAETGRGGLECLINEQFDIVLMDCQLPDIDGEEVTRRLRQLERVSGRSHTPVIALTANALSGDRARCIESGMDDFLAKPFRQQELLETMRRWLERPRQQAQ